MTFTIYLWTWINFCSYPRDTYNFYKLVHFSFTSFPMKSLTKNLTTVCGILSDGCIKHWRTVCAVATRFQTQQWAISISSRGGVWWLLCLSVVEWWGTKSSVKWEPRRVSLSSQTKSWSARIQRVKRRTEERETLLTCSSFLLISVCVCVCPVCTSVLPTVSNNKQYWRWWWRRGY